MRIRFLRREVYVTVAPGHPDNPIFEAGSEHNLRPDLAERWIRRGAAVAVSETVAAASRAPVPPPAPPPAPPPRGGRRPVKQADDGDDPGEE